MYPDAVIFPQAEDELITDANRPQVGDDLQIIFRIPWGHNKIILDKCKGNSAKALFYIRKTIENNWSRDVLLNFLGTDLYERQGKAITNFSNTLPIEQSDLAQAITKDPYNFDFLTLRERYDEKELKDALDGYIIYTDTTEIKAFTSELSAIGRNINQIAKRINAGGPAYQADMEEIRERLDEIWQLQRRILSSQR